MADELERLVTKLAHALGEPALKFDARDLERLRSMGGVDAVRTLIAVCQARLGGRLDSGEAVAFIEAIERGEWQQVAERLGQPSSDATAGSTT